MPWRHCNTTVMDDQRCPQCGISKGAWTVKVDLTRVFKLHKTWPDDAIAQIQALQEAAERGTPFCERCERAKKEQRRPSTAPYEGDAAAQAEALEQAAADGTPFCEKCEQAKREREGRTEAPLAEPATS